MKETGNQHGHVRTCFTHIILRWPEPCTSSEGEHLVVFTKEISTCTSIVLYKAFIKELGWCFWHAAWMDMCSHVRTCFTHVIALAWAMHSLWKGDPISTYAGLSLGPESGLGCWAWCLDSPCARGKTARQQLLSYTQFWGLTHFSRSNACSGNAKHWHVDSNAFFHMQDRPVRADNWIRGGSPFFTERILL